MWQLLFQESSCEVVTGQDCVFRQGSAQGKAFKLCAYHLGSAVDQSMARRDIAMGQ
jgi:hypothetical protein